MDKRIKKLLEHYESLGLVEDLAVRKHELAKMLRSPRWRSDNCAVVLDSISIQIGTQALIDLLRSNSQQAWLGFAKVMEIQWWTKRIHLNIGAIPGSAFVMHVLNGQHERTTWLAEKLMACQREPGESRPYWFHSEFIDFALRIWCLAERIASSHFAMGAKRRIGTYQNILESWDDPKQLQLALALRCDEHVKRAHWNYNGDVADDFELRPFGLIPLEILYIQHMRSRLALETLLPKHPLLETPVADLEKWSNLPPPEPDLVVDQLRDQVLALARKEGELPLAGEETRITWTRQRDFVEPETMSPTNAVSKPKAAPKTPFQKALSCLPFDGDPPELAADATALDFANAATDSTVAYYVDWKAPNDAALGELATGILGADDCEAETQNDMLVLTVTRGSKEHHFEIQEYAARSQYELIARFVAFYAPKRVALALVPYEGSDSSVYLIFTKSQHTAFKKALKADYVLVARELVVSEG